MFIPMLVVFSLALFAVPLSALFISNKFTVEPDHRERLVLQNIFTGGLRVLGPGSYYCMPWWKELTRVILNREPINVPPSPDPAGGDQFRAKHGVVGRIQYGYDILSGRRYDRVSGNLLGNPDDANEVDDEVVALAATRINFSSRFEIISRIVSAAIDAVVGNYSADMLFRPAKHGKTAAEVYAYLSKLIEAGANSRLTHVGINIVGFRITNMVPNSPALQEAIEREETLAQIAEAANRMIRDMRGSISPQAAMVATTPAAFAEVSRAEAIKAVANALASVGGSISDAARNYGRGGRRPF